MRTFQFLLSVALLAVGPLRAAEFNVEQFTADAKAAAARNYRDPGSAQFRDTYWIRWKSDAGNAIYAMCGEVNAKNAYGAYIGFAPFYVYLFPDGKLSASSTGSELDAQMAIKICTGQLRPVERIN